MTYLASNSFKCTANMGQAELAMIEAGIITKPFDGATTQEDMLQGTDVWSDGKRIQLRCSTDVGPAGTFFHEANIGMKPDASRLKKTELEKLRVSDVPLFCQFWMESGWEAKPLLQRRLTGIVVIDLHLLFKFIDLAESRGEPWHQGIVSGDRGKGHNDFCKLSFMKDDGTPRRFVLHHFCPSCSRNS